MRKVLKGALALIIAAIAGAVFSVVMAFLEHTRRPNPLEAAAIEWYCSEKPEDVGCLIYHVTGRMQK